MQLKYLKIMEVAKHLTVIDATIHLAQLCEAERKMGIKRGQKKYAFEYMKLNAGKFVKQGDMLSYCDSRRCEDTNGKSKNFKDNSRAIEQMRKDKLPLEWDEVYVDGELWFRYDPSIKEKYGDEIVNQHAHKTDTFSPDIIKSKLHENNHRCEITGIPFRESKDANADHFIPREKGGLSLKDNCVMLNAHLNTSKNKKMPVEWFCKSLLANFLNICRRLGMIEGAKDEIIQYIIDF
jgi:hypothetical protein